MAYDTSDVERAVLGAMLINHEAPDRAAELLTTDYFYERRHKLIFGAIMAVHLRGEIPGQLTVGEELKKGGLTVETGGAMYLAELASCIATGEAFDDLSCIATGEAFDDLVTDHSTPPHPGDGDPIVWALERCLRNAVMVDGQWVMPVWSVEVLREAGISPSIWGQGIAK